MGKGRNKNNAKQALMGMKKNSNGLQNRKHANLLKIINFDEQIQVGENSVNDLEATVQVTEMQKFDICATENDLTENKHGVIVQKKSTKARLRKSDKIKGKHFVGKENDGKSPGEVLIYPTDVDGETCIDIECGANEAVMYLSRLCVGSKGACINFSNSWFTPNEFQLLSGRETAKDWKRSIRHKGCSLKLLICKGLIQIKPAMPTKPSLKSELNNDIQGQKETKDAVKKEINVAEENVVQNEMPKALCDIPKQKRGRKSKSQRPRKKAGRREKVFFAACSSKAKSQDHIAVDETEHDNSNTAELSASFILDTRTDEEKRLDEFVKSLRLTKTTVVSSLKIDGGRLEKEENVLVNMVRDDDEPKMPILQKEADVLPPNPSYNIDQSKLLVAVDAFHTTVTPPPTPPSQQADTEQKVVDDSLVETFKSHFTSQGDGLKLRINREKVKINLDFDEISSPCIIAGNMESTLLQDTLQSTKTYKQELHQNKYQSPSETVSQVPRTASYFKIANHLKEIKDGPCSKLDQMKKEATRSQFSSSLMRNSVTSLTKSNKMMNNRATNVTSNVISGNEKPEVTAHAHDIDVSKDIINELGNKKQYTSKGMPRPFHNDIQSAPKMEDVRHIYGMNFNEFMTMMTSAYSPLPFSADSIDAARAFAIWQKLHRNIDMYNVINPCHPEGTSPLLYPMFTQQILLAMSQQLYSLCNVPNGMPQQLRNLIPPQLPNLIPPQLQKNSTQSSKESSVKRVVNCNVTPPDALPRNKRKQVNIELDCALDLSTKKPRVETNNILRQVYAPPRDGGPLDFSIQTPNIPANCMNSTQNKCFIDRDGYTHLNKNSNYDNGRSYIEHVPLTVNNYTNTHKPPNEIHSHLPYEFNGVLNLTSPSCRCGRTGIINDEMTSWSVERVGYFLKSLDGCGQYAKTFHDQGISGRLLPYLTTQHLTRTLGMKVGPALTLIQAVERKFREQQPSSAQSSCTYCKSYPQMMMPLLMLP